MTHARATLLLMVALLTGGPTACRSNDPPESGAWLSRLAGGRGRTAAGPHWPVPPERLERLMLRGKGELQHRAGTDTGVTGAERWTLYFPALRRTIRVKWKAAPPGDADGWNNSPRKELAAYALQKWFLEPPAYVVPTTVARCVPIDDYRRIEPDAEPTLPGTRCVLGVQALWLEEVEVPETLYDEERFRREPVYARHLANFNLFAYLIEDRDTRPANVLTAKNPANRRVFSVDNGISFDGKLYNLFENEWQHIRVPALPRASIERLRAVTRERARALATVAQLRADREGVLRNEEPGPSMDPSEGSHFRDGVLQLGLTDAEIEKVWQRLQELLREVDDRKIPLF